MESQLKGGDKADVGVREGNGIGDLDGGGAVNESAQEEAVDGGGSVLQGVEDELYVCGLGELVLAVGAHCLCLLLRSAHSLDPRCRERRREEQAAVLGLRLLLSTGRAELARSRLNRTRAALGISNRIKDKAQ